MFDQFKSMGALAGLMKNKERLNEAAERVKVRLAELRVEGEAGGGVVKVVATGEMKIVDVHVEPALASGFGADEQSRVMAQSMIAEATNEALKRARDEMQAILAAEMEALGLPPMMGDFGNLLT